MALAKRMVIDRVGSMRCIDRRRWPQPHRRAQWIVCMINLGGLTLWLTVSET